MEVYIIGAGLIIMMVSLSGALLTGQAAANFFEDKLSFLISFSAGVFLVTSGALALEVFELADTAFVAATLIGVGYLSAWLLEYLMPETHQHHDHGCEHGHQPEMKKGARKLLIGDAVHNIADGIMLVPAFVVSPALGFAVTTSILIHETLQEVSEYFVLRKAGYSVKKALLTNFVVSSTIFVGILLSYFALASHDLEVALLAISAGFFAHVVLHDLLPKPHHHTDSHGFFKHVVVLICGLALMAFLSLAISGEHEHSESEHHEDDLHI